MNIVLMGAPGAGKDTLANKLSTIYGYKILTTGELYRREKELGTEFGLHAFSYWGNGNLCPDDMTNELMRKATSAINGQVAVYNGYPRTAAQAKYLDTISKIGLILNIDVTADVAVDRLLKRGRVDDKESVIVQRFQVYRTNNVGVIEYYGNRLKNINGNGSPADVLSAALPLILDAASH